MVMLMRSMTGYGMGLFQNENYYFKAEIKSVNSRFSEFNIRMPKSLIGLEDKVRKFLKSEIQRGKVDVFINFNNFSVGESAIQVDLNLAKAYKDALLKLKENLGLYSEVNLYDIYNMQGVLNTGMDSLDLDSVWLALKSALEMALEAFVSMREKEGLAIKKDFLIKLDDVREDAEFIKEKAPFVLEENKAKLKNNIEKNLSKEEVDLPRLTTELALMCDRLSIDEEITRIFSHIDQFNDIIKRNDSIGRNLDFLVQELNREVNTIGSKTSDIEILNRVVALKTHIEKLREQLQNIE
ncbi:TIGR00255 family protein [Clostridiales bacterium KA00134]|nr:TIGR00255 family protein [Clostridiales bacterium KA00134]